MKLKQITSMQFYRIRRIGAVYCRYIYVVLYCLLFNLVVYRESSLHLFRPWKDRINIYTFGPVRMIPHICEYFFQIWSDPQVIRFCSFYQAVDRGTCCCAINARGKQPVAAPNCKGPNAVFTQLSLYTNKQVYVQDIFILIFCQSAHVQLISTHKNVDNISFVSDNEITKSLKEVISSEAIRTKCNRCHEVPER